MRYLLGVDGGNTKTDYLLCTEDGDFVDVLRTGTCSHEQTDESYDGMEKTMREQLQIILKRNGITVSDIVSGGFGLAGCDLPVQREELMKRVKNIGFKQFNLFNDGIVGVKAASESGAGICVVNGTSTVVIGIDLHGKIQQVGGVGEISGDLAGGTYVMRRCIYYLYEYYFRCGRRSGMFPEIMKMLNLTEDKLIEVSRNFWEYYDHVKEIVQLADREALKGDAVAMGIFDDMGLEMARSAAGCAKLLDFGEFGTDNQPLPVVLVGSIWHKVMYPGMKNVFEKTFKELAKKASLMVPLNAPPAVGGVLWAKEILTNKPVSTDYRKKILDFLTLEKYESLVKG